MLLLSTLQKSFLSYSQATTILRPFIFSVHPDFFMNNPEEKKQNESSLKFLNSHLQNINFKCVLPSAELSLKFHMRRSSENSVSIQTVTLSLSSVSLSDTVKNILMTANLPLTDLQTLLDTEKRKPAVHRQIVYDELPHVPPQPAKSAAVSLEQWVQQNKMKIVEAMRASRTLHNEFDQMIHTVRQLLQLRDLPYWKDDSISVSSKLSDLRAVERAAHSSPHIWMNDPTLAGCRLVFSRDASGSDLNCLGDTVILAVGQSPDSWTGLVSRLRQQRDLVVNRRIVHLEKAVSSLLHGARVVRLNGLQQTLSSEVYANLLKRLLVNLADFQRRSTGTVFHPRTKLLSRCAIVIEPLSSPAKDVGFVSSPSGPSSASWLECDDVAWSEATMFCSADTDPDLLIGGSALSKLEELVNQCEQQSVHRRQSQQEWHSLRQSCIRKFTLRDLQKENNVALSDALNCLQTLIRSESTALTPLAHGVLRIGVFYSVDSGGITLPHNFFNSK